MTTPVRQLPALPAPTSTANVIRRYLMVLASQVGLREGHDGSGWNNDQPFGVWYGTPRVSWCAQFVSWGASMAGLLGTVIPKHQYTPSGAAWFQAHGRARQSKPRAGDVMYVYSASAGRIAHVGVVEAVLPDGRVQTIEGNTNTSGSAQGNGVYRLKRRVTSRLWFYRPDYAKAVVPPKPGARPAVIPDRRLFLDELRYAAMHNSLAGIDAATRPGAADRIRYAKAALRILGCGNDKTDGFRQMWARWQRMPVPAMRKPAWSGADADGVPGDESVWFFARRTGRSYKRSKR